MGNNVSADKQPIKWSDLEDIVEKNVSATHSPATNGLSPPGSPTNSYGCNIKVWCISYTGGSASCTPVNLTSDTTSIASDCSYIVLVTKLKGVEQPLASSEKISQSLRECFTPRGLRTPASLGMVSETASTEATVYIFTGHATSGIVKATSLLRSMQLERLLLSHPLLCDTLFSGPSMYTSRDCLAAFNPIVSGGGHAVSHASIHLLIKKEPLTPQSTGMPIYRDPTTGTATGSLDFSSINQVPVTEPELDEKAVEQRARDKLQLWAPQCSEVLPYLFVGGQAPAEDLETLINKGITHVMNLVLMLVNCCFPEHFSYFAVRMMDNINEDISVLFPHAIAHIEHVRKNDGKIIVHCQQGASRSCTVILAYLLWKEKKSVQETLDFLRTRRGIAKPNMGFTTRLNFFEKTLSSPLPFQIYRLQPFSLDAQAPLVFVPELGNPAFSLSPRVDDADPSCIIFDSRTVYLVVHQSTKSFPYPNDCGAAFLWNGSNTREEIRKWGKLLSRDILRYNYRPGSMPEGWGDLDITDMDQGNETEAFKNIPELKSLKVEMIASLDKFYGDEAVEEIISEATAFYDGLADDKLTCTSKRRKETRTMDYLALKGGSETLGDATPRLKGQKLGVTDLFTYTNGTFIKHPTYSSSPFDEEEFDQFRDENSTSTCLFLKHKVDQKLLDIWCGYSIDEAPTIEFIVSEFKKWLTTKDAPAYAQLLVMDSIVPSLTIDGDDDDADIRFFGRWVRD
eukprot:TRINITY_DN7978_c0_g1_i2.p1 TRINITY_DN7978_c0_g1~~TRINITY_DN7978_c0_g1_i2.p1  ORF type:complete len:750 (+),score=116.44 TRINITY_DN7978_c0_g1_i2:38-2251(+)